MRDLALMISIASIMAGAYLLFTSSVVVSMALVVFGIMGIALFYNEDEK